MRRGKASNPYVKAEVEDAGTKQRVLDACSVLSKRFNRNVTISQVVNAMLAEASVAGLVEDFVAHEKKR